MESAYRVSQPPLSDVGSRSGPRLPRPSLGDTRRGVEGEHGNTVLVGVDGSPPSHKALAWAAAEAGITGPTWSS